jgi:hypothetical protein
MHTMIVYSLSRIHALINCRRAKNLRREILAKKVADLSEGAAAAFDFFARDAGTR